MNKFLCMVAIAIIIPTASVFAGNASGCGLGSQVWAGSSGAFANVSAVTTNGTSASQTFGITSGTSGCSSSDVVLQEKESEVFVADNMDALEQNSSRGAGEYLSTYAVLMGCPSAESEQAFVEIVNTNHDRVFNSEDARTVVANTRQVLASNQKTLACVK